MILKRKKDAYRNCFCDGDSFTTSGKLVIKELQQFCEVYAINSLGIKSSNNMIDPVALAEREGKRQVYNFIIDRLTMSDKEYLNIKEKNENQF